MKEPYSPPLSDVEPLVDGDGLELLPRFSAWGVFGLTLITLGVYYMYWLYTRTNLLNGVVDKPIPGWLVVVSCLTYVGYIGLSVLPETYFTNDMFLVMSGVVTLVYLVFYYWWLFAVRARLLSLVNRSAYPGFKIGAVLSTLIQVIYFQYKINEYIDRRQTP